MKTHGEVVRALMMRTGVKVEVARIAREEGELLDALLKARQEAGLTQAQLAARMGTQAPAVARLEKSLATGQHLPPCAAMQKRVAKICGYRSADQGSSARRAAARSSRLRIFPDAVRGKGSLAKVR